MDARISGCAGENYPLFGHIGRAGTAGATCFTAAMRLLAAWAILCARFWPSGLLAPAVGPREPTSSCTIHVNAPLTAARVGQLCLQARSANVLDNDLSRALFAIIMALPMEFPQAQFHWKQRRTRESSKTAANTGAFAIHTGYAPEHLRDGAGAPPSGHGAYEGESRVENAEKPEALTRGQIPLRIPRTFRPARHRYLHPAKAFGL